MLILPNLPTKSHKVAIEDCEGHVFVGMVEMENGVEPDWGYVATVHFVDEYGELNSETGIICEIFK